MNNFILVCVFAALCSCTLPKRYGSSLTPEQQQAARQLQYYKTGEKIKNGEIRFDGGDGLSIENAIIINGAQSEGEGIPAGFIYIMKKHGEGNKDWKTIMQSLTSTNGKSYDEIQIEDIKNNKKVAYYFDIAAFLGKY